MHLNYKPGDAAENIDTGTSEAIPAYGFWLTNILFAVFIGINIIVSAVMLNGGKCATNLP